MNTIRTFIKDPKVMKMSFAIFLALLISMALFLMISLINYYNRNYSLSKEALVYNFNKNSSYLAQNYDYSQNVSNESYMSYAESYGIDVSEWQGQINWDKVAKTGISFVMIRCGGREISGSKIYEDGNFKRNIEEATRVGLRVGIYFYGTARNIDEALEEAEFTYNLIKDYNITYPVAYDTETFATGRLQNISYSAQTDIALAYTETMEAYGYSTMIYSYANAFIYKFDTGKFDGKLIWLANFTEDNWYKGNHAMWQYTSDGRVDGISGRVDLNVSYFEYVDDENKIVTNPREVTPPTVNFTEVNENVITKGLTTYRSSATTEIPNRLGYLNYGTKLIRTGKGETFSKVLYNGKIVYVKNTDLRVLE